MLRAPCREVVLWNGGWLRAAVLGANDGIVSTASLIVGVAGLAAGALSLAAGEYVSVSSQADVERAEIAKGRGALARQPALEREELAQIYVKRGVKPGLARKVAEQMMAQGALAAPAHDELGISPFTTARPIRAA